MTSDELNSATISLPCALHGQIDPDADGAARVQLPADAVYLFERPLEGSDATVMCALGLCDGHVIRRVVGDHEWRLLRIAGAVTVDSSTAGLLMAFASPTGIDIADRALAEVEDVAHLRDSAAIAAAMHLMDTQRIGDMTAQSAAIRRIRAVSKAFRARVGASGGAA
jgi:hypothetical protein